MSKKASLAKKIAHTLMAMSIVYSSGINIVINEAYAAERTENITSGGTKEFEEKTVNGGDYSSAQVTSSADAILTGKITEADVSSGEIKLEVQSGDGGDDNGDAPTTMQGSSSGTAVAKITVDESLSSITTGNRHSRHSRGPRQHKRRSGKRERADDARRALGMDTYEREALRDYG